jgi:hypothetical protein
VSRALLRARRWSVKKRIGGLGFPVQPLTILWPHALGHSIIRPLPLTNPVQRVIQSPKGPITSTAWTAKQATTRSLGEKDNRLIEPPRPASPSSLGPRLRLNPGSLLKDEAAWFLRGPELGVPSVSEDWVLLGLEEVDLSVKASS